MMRLPGVMAGRWWEAMMAPPLKHELLAWGANNYGQLGVGDTVPSLDPRPVADSTSFLVIRAGGIRSYAIDADRNAYAWGHGLHLGFSDDEDRLFPLYLGDNYRDIVAASGHALAIRANGDLYSWGYNSFGQLGMAGNTARSTPGFVRSGVIQIAAGTNHSLALTTDGTVIGTGSGSDGQLAGQPTTDVFLPLAQDCVSCAAGGWSSFVLTAAGDILSTGDNRWGQLGLGDFVDRTGWALVATGFKALSIHPGGYHVLALGGDGSLWVWGSNYHGQLGVGGEEQPNGIIGPTGYPCMPSPTKIAEGVRHISAGGEHSLWLDRDGRLFGCGVGYALAVGDPNARFAPVEVGGGPYRGISAGSGYTLALRAAAP